MTELIDSFLCGNIYFSAKGRSERSGDFSVFTPLSRRKKRESMFYSAILSGY